MSTQYVQPARYGRIPGSSASRRFGYVVGAAINLVLLWLIYVEPGWRAAPFLTSRTTAVLGLLTLSIAASAAVNLLYAIADPYPVKHLGDALTAALSCASSLRILQIFPFDFTNAWSGWATVARVVLIVAVIGTAIATLVNIVQLVVDPLGRKTIA
jgi:hypothetical protein